MKLLLSLAIFAVLDVFVSASRHAVGDVRRAVQHDRLARRSTGRCKPRQTSSNSGPPPASSTSSTTSLFTSSYTTSSYTPPSSSPSPVDTFAWNIQATSSSSPSPLPTGNNNAQGGSGLINVQWSATCGNTGATTSISSTSGPNGDINWLNCGVTGGGWSPPHVAISDIVYVDLSWAVTQPGSPFTACTNYIWAFVQFGNQFGVPPILLASFAMQESSCNPSTVGGAGEQGLMQITKDKCGGAPGGDCKDVGFNVMTGAKYFADTLAANNGNLLLTIGNYNGWFPGMTYGDAVTFPAGCCRCQPNLDYIFQFLNGWTQNIDAYKNGLGLYFNLNGC